MMISSAEVLNSRLKPLCSRDNHLMKYELGGSKSNSGNRSSYHCGFQGCSVRYNSTDGYYMLVGMPNHANPVDEPGVNIAKCPIHGRWLYRRESIKSQPGIRWFCGIEDCAHGYNSNTEQLAGPNRFFRQPLKLTA
jgi:hypothetical protein